ncbi:MAG: LssY C-terminal domain-containing protein, partial [Deltaproteobacteria bacterium]|nr:LssY C-terminal domain-containing protein [Deltaproteobacteria bacterium]
MLRHGQLHWLTLLTIPILAFYGCATFNPRPIDEVPFRERAQTQAENNVWVTAAVLSAEESEAVFGVPLYKKGIQPIWLEIDNKDEEPVWFLPVGLDPEYFAPLEVAYMHRFTFSKKANHRMEKYFNEQAMGQYIAPGSVRTGFVFTNLDMGSKAFNVDLVGEDHQVRTFTFFIPVPGLRVTHHDVDWDNLYAKNEILTYDEEGLRKALESLPCCTTNQDGTKKGDPLNVVFIGKDEDLHYALIASGWDETESAKTFHAMKQRPSSVIRRQDRYAPVSPFYLFRRPQDAAFRKTRENARERNQLRLWLNPMTFEGKLVWIGQISREVRVRSLLKRRKIEPDLDEARTYIFQDFLYSQGLAKYGYVKGVGAA